MRVGVIAALAALLAACGGEPIPTVETSPSLAETAILDARAIVNANRNRRPDTRTDGHAHRDHVSNSVAHARPHGNSHSDSRATADSHHDHGAPTHGNAIADAGPRIGDSGGGSYRLLRALFGSCG